MLEGKMNSPVGYYAKEEKNCRGIFCGVPFPFPPGRILYKLTDFIVNLLLKLRVFFVKHLEAQKSHRKVRLYNRWYQKLSQGN